MKINAIITGSTGMVGKGVLLECIEREDVDKVLVINRSSAGINNKKLTEILHDDFYDLSSIQDQLKGFNACFFCLGVTSAGMDKAKYEKITYDMTIYFAETLLALNPDMVFFYVSGSGTSTNGKSRMHWANVKGRTENKILEMGFKDAYMFRPGFIQPMKGIKSKTGWYQAIYNVLSPMYPFLRRIFPSSITNTITLGQAMINIAQNGYSKKHLENGDINDAGG
ncbi:MAG: epimerase [Bacteroidota bacterium]